MQARRHQKIARAFRRRGGEDRGLEFEEALLFHPPPQRVDDRAALHDVAMQMLAPQIEKAIAQPDVFRVFLLAEHRHRQFGRAPQHLDLADIDFDLAGRQVGIVGALRPPPHLAVDAHHPFGTQRLRDLEGGTVGIGDHLGDAVMIAQIDEKHATMVADAMAPARKAHVVADVACAKRAAGVAAITVHCRSLALLVFRSEGGKRMQGAPLSRRARLGFRLAGMAPMIRGGTGRQDMRSRGADEADNRFRHGQDRT